MPVDSSKTMVHKRFRGHYPAMAFLAMASLFVTAFTLFAAPSVFAATTACAWVDQSTVTCNGETFNDPTINGANMTLTGTNAQPGNEAAGCAVDTLEIDSYQSNPPGKLTLTTYTATATGKFSSACSPTSTNSVTLSGKYASVPAADPNSTQGTGSTGCGGGALDWAVCPLNTILQKSAEALTTFINEELTINTRQLFGTGCTASDNGTAQCSTSQAYYNAWNTFRILGTSLIVIAGLIMVISQALGFEILDAYTVRKVLPRLLIALIGMSLSWPLLSFLINFFNELGRAMQALIYAPFSHLPNNTQLVAGFVNWGLLAFLAAAAFTPFITVVLPILGTGLLALLIGLLVLIIRQIAVTLIVILSPLLIAAYVLPNTQKVSKIGSENFWGLMLMFPIVDGFLAVGQVFAAVGDSGNTVQQIVGMVAWFVPFFLIPLAFRMATGFISTISGFVNDRSKGGFDRLRNARQKTVEDNVGAIKQGFNRTRLGTGRHAMRQRGLNRLSAWGAGSVGVGGHGTARYRSEMANAEFGHLAGAAAESIKNNPAAAANDDANKIAQFATNKDDFIQRYVTSGLGTRDDAINQLAYTEQAYGTVMGSKQMQHTAATAALASASSTDRTAERAAWMRHAVSQDIMTDSQAAALVKQSGSLVSSAGFGDLLGAANGTLSDDELLKRASNGFNAANSHRMRKEQARELAVEVRRQASNARTEVEFATAVANAAGMHDVINGMTPDVREAFATELNGASVTGNGINQRMRDHEADLEASTGLAHEAYLDRRKTWAAQAAAAGGGIPGGAPGGAPGGGGGAPGGGAPPSDARLKRDIVQLGITNGVTIYSFRYLWSNQTYVGVMAQDLLNTHPEALSVDEFGFYQVNYTTLGLRMMTIEEWQAAGAESLLVAKD